MSRTKHDLPEKIQLRDNMRKGKIKHRHTLIGKTISYKVKSSETFHAGDPKIEFLINRLEKMEDTSFTVKRDKLNKFVFNHDTGYYNVVVDNVVVIESVTLHKKKLYSDYCTDAEHYDYETGKDTRDDLPSACVPEVVNTKNCSHCGRSDCGNKKVVSKIRRKGEFAKIMKTFNSGYDVDDLYDYDDTVIDHEYAPSNYGTYC